MPLSTQRRNTAYLNPAILRCGWENCGLDGPAPRALLDLRFISGARSYVASDPMESGSIYLERCELNAPRQRRANPLRCSLQFYERNWAF